LKAFDEKNVQLATSQARVQALESQIAAMKPKKRKRVETSPNSKFATIGDIQRAMGNDLEEEIISIGSSDSESDSSAASCIEVR
jgi:hypothetical protein